MVQCIRLYYFRLVMGGLPVQCEFEHSQCPLFFPWARNVTFIAQYWLFPGTDLGPSFVVLKSVWFEYVELLKVWQFNYLSWWVLRYYTIVVYFSYNKKEDWAGQWRNHQSYYKVSSRDDEWHNFNFNLYLKQWISCTLSVTFDPPLGQSSLI